MIRCIVVPLHRSGSSLSSKPEVTLNEETRIYTDKSSIRIENIQEIVRESRTWCNRFGNFFSFLYFYQTWMEENITEMGISIEVDAPKSTKLSDGETDIR